jgi:hypothetical protein
MLPAMVLLGMMLFTWGAAVWASLHEEDDRPQHPLRSERPRKWAA